MAQLKVLKDAMLGGDSNVDVYPVTSTQAIYSHYVDGQGNLHVREKNGVPEKIEDRLQDQEDDSKELHRKTEKLIVRIVSNLTGTLECTGNSYTMNLTGSAGLETYGDEAEEVLSADSSKPKHMSHYTLAVNGPSYVDTDTGEMVNDNIPFALPTISGDNVVGSINITKPGTYTSRFEVTNDDGKSSITKTATSIVHLALKMYYGFSTNRPSSVTSLDGNSYSNSVAGTITIPQKSDPQITGEEKFQHVYIALPRYLVGTKTVTARQPDSLNAPFPLRKISTISRTVGAASYDYYLYESGTTSTSDDGKIDSTIAKRLTLIIS